mgnify:CR=1 FL=1
MPPTAHFYSQSWNFAYPPRGFFYHSRRSAFTFLKDLHDSKAAAAQQHIDVFKTNTKAASQQHTDVFKTNTKATINRINQIISHECGRLILLVMPNGESTSIFKRLLHHRSKYLGDLYKYPTKYGPYNAMQPFAYLRKQCRGNNERMRVL